MEDQANQAPPPQDEEEDSKKEEEELIAKVNKLMEKITSAPDNPNATVLHALASILEAQESRYACYLCFCLTDFFSCARHLFDSFWNSFLGVYI